MSPAPPRPDPLPALLEELYAGIATPAPWEAFLRALSSETSATYATLLLGRERGMPETIVTPDANPRTAVSYASDLFARDPFVGLPEGRVVSFADFVSPAAMSADFRQFLATSDSQNIVGLDLRDEHGGEARVRLTRDSSLPDFREAERHVLERLIPHLRIALRLFQRLQTSAAAEGVYRGAIEQLALATIMLDRDGRVVRSNAVADRLLGMGNGLAVDGGRLRVPAEAGAELRRLLAMPPDGTEAVTLRIARPSGAPELAAVVRRVPGHGAPGGAVLALFIRDPDGATRASPEALRDLFQLTRAEALLAAALGDGCSLQDAARSLGIAHNTARAQLRLIFAKTGAHRQSQLVHLLRSSVAGLSGRDRG